MVDQVACSNLDEGVVGEWDEGHGGEAVWKAFFPPLSSTGAWTYAKETNEDRYLIEIITQNPNKYI